MEGSRVPHSLGSLRQICDLFALGCKCLSECLGVWEEKRFKPQEQTCHSVNTSFAVSFQWSGFILKLALLQPVLPKPDLTALVLAPIELRTCSDLRARNGKKGEIAVSQKRSSRQFSHGSKAEEHPPHLPHPRWRGEFQVPGFISLGTSKPRPFCFPKN